MFANAFTRLHKIIFTGASWHFLSHSQNSHTDCKSNDCLVMMASPDIFFFKGNMAALLTKALIAQILMLSLDCVGCLCVAYCFNAYECILLLAEKSHVASQGPIALHSFSYS